MDNKDEYFDFLENGIEQNQSQKALEILEDVTKIQNSFFESDSKTDADYLDRSDKLLKQIQDLKDSNSIQKEQVEELYKETGYFRYTKKFRINQQSEINTNKSLEILTDIEDNIAILKSEYLIED